MLKRRPKRRYLAVVQSDNASDPAVAIKKRFSELFGTIATENASLRVIERTGNEFIIRCTKDQLENILVAIALIDPPMLTIGMSGSIKRLKRHMQHSY